jgi:hypothetical protein
MNELYPLISAIAVSLLVSTVILLTIVKPLRQILAMLCKSGEATPFWVSFTIVMLYAAPLFSAVLWTPIFKTTMVFALRSALIAALFGAIVGMLIVGSKLANARQI